MHSNNFNLFTPHKPIIISHQSHALSRATPSPAPQSDAMRFLLVIYPAQGHINPGLQFAKRLIRMGAEVTFVTNLSAHRRMTKPSTPTGLSFAPFSDGYDDGFKPGDDVDHYLSEISRCGSQALTDLIVTASNEGRPFSFIIYSILLPWAAETANQLHVPSALLWIQPATVFDIYYYYLHDYSDVIIDNTNSNSTDGISCFVELPGLPLKLTKRDLPSFMDAGNTYTFVIPLMKAQFEILDKESNPKVLLNTFDALEPEALRATGGKFDLIGVGPLIPSAFLDGKDPSDTSFGGDFIQHSKDYYMEWLNTKPKRSVIYVSFGSMSVLSKPQMEELGRALLSIGRPFLWVIRDKKKDENEEEEDKLVSCREELERLGMLVPWCSQVEVLSNPSLGCFVTHCGWNSTLESLVCGVPMVGFPQWSDQGTNAKLIEDFWKTGLRVKTNKDGIVERDEFQRCLEMVMGDGEKGEEMRLNAKKWKDLSREAANEGGSSDKNLKDFVNEINLKEAAVS